MVEKTDVDRREAQTMLDRGSHPRKPLQEGSKTPQYLYSIAATMSAFCAGMALAWTGPVKDTLTPSNQTTISTTTAISIIDFSNTTNIANSTAAASALILTADEFSWVGSLVAVGGLIGALPTGSIANLYGRKLVCLSLSLPFALAWVITAFATTAWHLYLARLIIGIATGASSAVAPMYVGEIAESSVRGSLGSFFQLLLTMGILYVYTVGAYASYTALSIFCGVIPLLFLIMFFNAPETPVYLLSKGQKSEAQASLQRLRGSCYDISYELHELEKEMEKSAGNKATLSDLFTRKSAFKALIICLGLMLFQQLSGVNAVIFYANSIFKDAGSTLSPAISTIIIGVIQVVCTYGSSLLVDKAGRKILLLVSISVMAVCQGLLGLYFYLKDNGNDVSNLSMIPLGSVALFIILFSFGFGPIPWMMAAELFTPDVKGPATGMAVGLNWLLAFVVTKFFDPLKDTIGLGMTFGIFCIICCLGAVFVLFVVIETKGKSVDDIQKILAGEKKNQIA